MKDTIKQNDVDPTWMEKTGGYAKDMTLRDYFACKAMASLTGCPDWRENLEEDYDGIGAIEFTVLASYSIADAMLKGRNRAKKKDIEENKLHNTSVGSLILTMRAENCLRAGGIKTLGELLQCSRNNLMRIPNLGKRTLIEIEEMLAHLNLKLKDS